MSNSLILTYLLTDLASVYMMFPVFPGHKIKSHLPLVNNMKTICQTEVSQLRGLQQILALILNSILFNILMNVANNHYFFNKIAFVCCHEKRAITLISLYNGSDTQGKYESKRIGGLACEDDLVYVQSSQKYCVLS